MQDDAYQQVRDREQAKGNSTRASKTDIKGRPIR